MNILKKNIFLAISIILLTFLIIGYNLNKQSTISKKNEISNFAQQLKIRNSQLVEIQKNLFKNGQNINDLINQNEIQFKRVFENKQIADFNGYSFVNKKINENILEGYTLSKFTTNDILFSGNIGAAGTGYIELYNKDENIFLTTTDGIFAFAEIKNPEKFTKINSNINSIIKYDKFYYDDQYGIKDIFIDETTLYVSYIGEKKENCYDLKIISTELNKKFLNFELFFETDDCIDTKNNHGYWPHQGAGGRIEKIDNSNLLFTTGDFRNRPVAQDLARSFGKILKINTQSKKADVISLGHRNPQGLFYSKKFDFILSTEHGPKGGDEININHKPFSEIKNFGWPISSYGEHYATHYSERILKEAPLHNSHKKYGFVEPIKYFVPSIGISQTISLNQNDDEFLVGAMGNEILDQDLGIHYIKLDKNRKKIINHDYIPLNERVRDMIISQNKDMIILFLETTSSIIILKKS